MNFSKLLDPIKPLITLSGYALVGCMFFFPEYLPYFFAITFLGMFIRGDNGTYCKSIWYSFDVLIATICHRTRHRSISGLAGQYYLEKRTGSSIVRNVINGIFFFEPYHCEFAFEWERGMGFVD